MRKRNKRKSNGNKKSSCSSNSDSDSDSDSGSDSDSDSDSEIEGHRDSDSDINRDSDGNNNNRNGIIQSRRTGYDAYNINIEGDNHDINKDYVSIGKNRNSYVDQSSFQFEPFTEMEKSPRRKIKKYRGKSRWNLRKKTSSSNVPSINIVINSNVPSHSPPSVPMHTSPPVLAPPVPIYTNNSSTIIIASPSCASTISHLIQTNQLQFLSTPQVGFDQRR